MKSRIPWGFGVVLTNITRKQFETAELDQAIPGDKVMNASTEKSTVKARSQLRMSVQHLEQLYQKFGPENF